MTDQQKDDIGHAFAVVGKTILVYGGQFVAILAVMFVVGRPHLESYAGGIAVDQITKELRSDCFKDPNDPEYNPHSLACANADRAEELRKVKQDVGTLSEGVKELTGAVDAHNRAITGLKGDLETFKAEQNEKLNTIIQLVQPPTPPN